MNRTVLSCLGLLLMCEPVLAADRPNIVLVMADDQGWGDVGFRTPGLKTPVMDELAQTGLHFTRFYAAAPVCSPTRGSVLTGRHPNRFGCFSWGHSLRPQEVTIAEALREAGYTTGHFGKWHLGPVRADSNASPGASGFDEWVSSPNFFDNHPLMSHRGTVIETEGESSIVTARLATKWIRAAAARDKPFLAVVWFGSPHGPHQALDRYRNMYADLPKNKQNFYGEVTAMDEAIGMLRDTLRELQVADHTLLWYTSDNGALPVGSTGGLAGRKGRLEEGGIRVPAMIEWPERIREAGTINTPCSTVDIYPTLIEVAGAKVRNQPVLDGMSLVPAFDGRMESREKPLGFWVHPTGGISTPSRKLLEQLRKEQAGEVPAGPPSPDAGRIRKQYDQDQFLGSAAWIDGRWKLHRRQNRGGAVSWLLFDLEADAAEEYDLAAERPEDVARMRAALEAWQRSVVHSLNGDDYAAAKP